MQWRQYRTEQLCSYWSNNNDGICLLDTCRHHKISEDLDHILFSCPGLNQTRTRLLNFTSNFISDKPELQSLVTSCMYGEKQVFCQFLVDCSTLPEVLHLFQRLGPIVHTHLFYITRTWCHSLHCDRLRQLGRFPIS